MTLINVVGMIFGVILVVCGLFGKGKFYNQVEAPLREEERYGPPPQFRKRDRVLYLGFGILLITLGLLGRFNY
jgi:hypothetical protein